MKVGQRKIDHVASDQGKWFDWIDGARVKLRRWDSYGYREAMRKARLDKEIQDAILKDDSTLKNIQEQDKKMCEIISECIVVDWEGVYETDENGNELSELTYDSKVMAEILFDDPISRKIIETYSQSLANFYIEKVKNAVGN